MEELPRWPRYRPIRVIGQGGFGTVYLCEDTEPTSPRYGQHVAVKAVALGALSDDEVLMMMSEVSLLRNIDHPNIVTYYDSFLYDEGGDKALPLSQFANGRAGSGDAAGCLQQWLCLVTEYMDGGDLAALLREYTNQDLVDRRRSASYSAKKRLLRGADGAARAPSRQSELMHSLGGTSGFVRVEAATDLGNRHVTEARSKRLESAPSPRESDAGAVMMHKRRRSHMEGSCSWERRPSFSHLAAEAEEDAPGRSGWGQHGQSATSALSSSRPLSSSSAAALGHGTWMSDAAEADMPSTPLGATEAGRVGTTPLGSQGFKSRVGAKAEEEPSASSFAPIYEPQLPPTPSALWVESFLITDIAKQCLDALAYLHALCIVHRDIKPSNVYLSKRDGTVKLGDFGVSKVLQPATPFATTFVGTPFYLCPELCMGDPYSFGADIWALGVLLYELYSLKLPFTSDNVLGQIYVITEGTYDTVALHTPHAFAQTQRTILENLYGPSFLESEKLLHSLVVNMVGQMLRVDPAERPSAEQLLATAFGSDSLSRNGSMAGLPTPVAPTPLHRPPSAHVLAGDIRSSPPPVPAPYSRCGSSAASTASGDKKREATAGQSPVDRLGPQASVQHALWAGSLLPATSGNSLLPPPPLLLSQRRPSLGSSTAAVRHSRGSKNGAGDEVSRVPLAVRVRDDVSAILQAMPFEQRERLGSRATAEEREETVELSRILSQLAATDVSIAASLMSKGSFAVDQGGRAPLMKSCRTGGSSYNAADAAAGLLQSGEYASLQLLPANRFPLERLYSRLGSKQDVYAGADGEQSDASSSAWRELLLKGAVGLPPRPSSMQSSLPSESTTAVQGERGEDETQALSTGGASALALALNRLPDEGAATAARRAASHSDIDEDALDHPIGVQTRSEINALVEYVPWIKNAEAFSAIPLSAGCDDVMLVERARLSSLPGGRATSSGPEAVAVVTKMKDGGQRESFLLTDQRVIQESPRRPSSQTTKGEPPLQREQHKPHHQLQTLSDCSVLHSADDAGDNGTSSSSPPIPLPTGCVSAAPDDRRYATVTPNNDSGSSSTIQSYPFPTKLSLPQLSQRVTASEGPGPNAPSPLSQRRVSSAPTCAGELAIVKLPSSANDAASPPLLQRVSAPATADGLPPPTLSVAALTASPPLPSLPPKEVSTGGPASALRGRMNGVGEDVECPAVVAVVPGDDGAAHPRFSSSLNSVWGGSAANLRLRPVSAKAAALPSTAAASATAADVDADAAAVPPTTPQSQSPGRCIGFSTSELEALLRARLLAHYQKRQQMLRAERAAQAAEAVERDKARTKLKALYDQTFSARLGTISPDTACATASYHSAGAPNELPGERASPATYSEEGYVSHGALVSPYDAALGSPPPRLTTLRPTREAPAGAFTAPAADFPQTAFSQPPVPLTVPYKTDMPATFSLDVTARQATAEEPVLRALTIRSARPVDTAASPTTPSGPNVEDKGAMDLLSITPAARHVREAASLAAAVERQRAQFLHSGSAPTRLRVAPAWREPHCSADVPGLWETSSAEEEKDQAMRGRMGRSPPQHLREEERWRWSAPPSDADTDSSREEETSTSSVRSASTASPPMLAKAPPPLMTSSAATPGTTKTRQPNFHEVGRGSGKLQRGVKRRGAQLSQGPRRSGAAESGDESGVTVDPAAATDYSPLFTPLDANATPRQSSMTTSELEDILSISAVEDSTPTGGSSPTTSSISNEADGSVPALSTGANSADEVEAVEEMEEDGEASRKSPLRSAATSCVSEPGREELQEKSDTESCPDDEDDDDLSEDVSSTSDVGTADEASPAYFSSPSSSDTGSSHATPSSSAASTPPESDDSAEDSVDAYDARCLYTIQVNADTGTRFFDYVCPVTVEMTGALPVGSRLASASVLLRTMQEGDAATSAVASTTTTPPKEDGSKRQLGSAQPPAPARAAHQRKAEASTPAATVTLVNQAADRDANGADSPVPAATAQGERSVGDSPDTPVHGDYFIELPDLHVSPTIPDVDPPHSQSLSLSSSSVSSLGLILLTSGGPSDVVEGKGNTGVAASASPIGRPSEKLPAKDRPPGVTRGAAASVLSSNPADAALQITGVQKPLTKPSAPPPRPQRPIVAPPLPPLPRLSGSASIVDSADGNVAANDVIEDLECDRTPAPETAEVPATPPMKGPSAATAWRIRVPPYVSSSALPGSHSPTSSVAASTEPAPDTHGWLPPQSRLAASPPHVRLPLSLALRPLRPRTRLVGLLWRLWLSLQAADTALVRVLFERPGTSSSPPPGCTFAEAFGDWMAGSSGGGGCTASESDTSTTASFADRSASATYTTVETGTVEDEEEAEDDDNDDHTELQASSSALADGAASERSRKWDLFYVEPRIQCAVRLRSDADWAVVQHKVSEMGSMLPFIRLYLVFEEAEPLQEPNDDASEPV